MWNTTSLGSSQFVGIASKEGGDYKPELYECSNSASNTSNYKIVSTSVIHDLLHNSACRPCGKNTQIKLLDSAFTDILNVLNKSTGILSTVTQKVRNIKEKYPKK